MLTNQTAKKRAGQGNRGGNWQDNAPASKKLMKESKATKIRQRKSRTARSCSRACRRARHDIMPTNEKSRTRTGIENKGKHGQDAALTFRKQVCDCNAKKPTAAAGRPVLKSALRARMTTCSQTKLKNNRRERKNECGNGQGRGYTFKKWT